MVVVVHRNRRIGGFPFSMVGFNPPFFKNALFKALPIYNKKNKKEKLVLGAVLCGTPSQNPHFSPFDIKMISL